MTKGDFIALLLMSALAVYSNGFQMQHSSTFLCLPCHSSKKTSYPMKMSPTPSERSTTLTEKKSEATSSSTINKTKNKVEKKGMVQLIFKGETKLTSEPISLSKLNESNICLKSFFLSTENRNLLLAKSEKEILPFSKAKTSKLLKTWSMQSENFPIDPNLDITSDNTCDMVEVSTPTQLPGMVLKNISTIGCKLVLPQSIDVNDDVDKSKSNAEMLDAQYEFTLIDTAMKPEGNAPVVWLFNKLTGSNKKAENQSEVEEPSSSSFTVVKIERSSSSTDEDEIVFTSDAKIKVRVEFPSILIRLLPLSLEDMEIQGSQSMQKVVDKEVGPALERFRNKLSSLM